MFLYDIYQENCLKLIEAIKTAKNSGAKGAYEMACYDLADYKVQYYSQFENMHTECSKIGKFYAHQLGAALRERAEVVDQLHEIGIEITEN
jgi:hypothetical protein